MATIRKMTKVTGSTIKRVYRNLITNGSRKRFKAEVTANLIQAIPLSREINKVDNELLTMVH